MTLSVYNISILDNRIYAFLRPSPAIVGSPGLLVNEFVRKVMEIMKTFVFLAFTAIKFNNLTKAFLKGHQLPTTSGNRVQLVVVVLGHHDISVHSIIDNPYILRNW